MEAILVDDVRKRYGAGAHAVDALCGVNLRVEAGQTCVLLGRQGAGKSTLLKILVGLVRPSGGAARVLGRPAGEAEGRRAIGYVPEDSRFPGYRTGAGTLGVHAALAGIGSRARARRVPELLELVGLERVAQQCVRGYDRSARQRLALAQALMHEPSVLLADEPTAGTDAAARADVLAVLARLARAGTTVLLGTHLLRDAENLADRIVVLDEGCVVREAARGELTSGESILRVVTVPALAAVTRAVLERGGAVLRLREDGFELVLRRADEIDRVVDVLRARGISIRALEPRQPTLEEVLLRAMQQRDTRVAAAAASDGA